MPTVNDFLKTVLRSGLLDRDQLKDALRKVPRDQREEPRVVADHLIKTGRLSRFQARKLLEGTPVGLKLGPFQVLAPVGRGGMGTVYLARDTRSGMLLALKVLPPKRAREEERILARFRREMEMSQKVAHPNLAWTYEVGVCQGVYYIAMEYIPGKSLHRLIHDEGPLAVPRAARLFAEVASALEHAHMQGLIHRDLKPSNIIITPNDHAKVLDLGLALKQGEPPTDIRVTGGAGYIVGTMDFIAPEQADDACNVDARSDIYALGCTLYFALSGRAPFPGGTGKDKVQCHRTVEPVSLEELKPDLPPGFVALVRRMMAKRPEQRFASASDLEHELRQWVAPDEKVLPLDQQTDPGFQQAVAQLETADFPNDVFGAVESDTPGPPEQAAPVVVPEAPAAFAPVPAWVWWTLGSIGVGAVVLLVVVVVVLLGG